MLDAVEYKVDSAIIEDMFTALERMEEKDSWKSNYRVMVCDGWSWDALIRFADRTVKLVEGTIELPPGGRKIAKKIRALLEDTICLIEPRLFGRD